MNLHEPHRRTVHLSCYGNQHGTVFVLVAFLLTVLIGVAALAVDIGYVAITRNQLQNAADAAALAGAGKLGSIYDAQTPPLSLNSTQAGAVAAVALTVGQENKAAGQPPNIEQSDIVIGYWDSKVNTFSNAPPSGPPPRILNAVRVIARPSVGGTTPLGSVTTFFANIFGISNVAVSTAATASLTSPCDLKPGGPSPFVISKDSPYCTNPNPDIYFTGNGQPCGGWQTFNVGVSAKSIKDMLNTLLSNNGCFSKGYPACSNGSTNFVFPDQKVGDTPNVMNGLTGNWDCLQNLYKCVRNAKNEWTVSVPVVLSPCSNIQKDGKIDSFATVTITGITIGSGGNKVVAGTACSDGSSPCIKASVVCDNVITEKGEGCAFYGTYGSIPGLVDKHKP